MYTYNKIIFVLILLAMCCDESLLSYLVTLVVAGNLSLCGINTLSHSNQIIFTCKDSA